MAALLISILQKVIININFTAVFRLLYRVMYMKLRTLFAEHTQEKFSKLDY